MLRSKGVQIAEMFEEVQQYYFIQSRIHLMHSEISMSIIIWVLKYY